MRGQWIDIADDRKVSAGPSCEQFRIPGDREKTTELDRVKALAEENCREGRETVAVLVLGSGGGVMAAAVADSTNGQTKVGKLVSGVQRPSSRSYWRSRCSTAGWLR